MSDIVKAAEVRAAEIIAKAHREAAIAKALPTSLEIAPLIVLQSDIAWLSYTPDSLSQMLSIFDAFDHVEALDCKGTYRRVTWDGNFSEKKHGTILSNYAGWVEIDSRCPDYLSGSQHASFRFYGRLTNGDIVQVGMAISADYFCKAGFPACLRTDYRNASRSERAKGDWTFSRPSIAQTCDSYVSFGTGADMPGMAHNGRAYFSDFRAFIESLSL